MDVVQLWRRQPFVLVVVKPWFFETFPERWVREVVRVQGNVGAARSGFFHSQRKLCGESIAAIVGVSYPVCTRVHLQGVAAHSAANPFTGLIYVKSSREGTQVKRTFGLINGNGVLVSSALEVFLR